MELARQKLLHIVLVVNIINTHLVISEMRQTFVHETITFMNFAGYVTVCVQLYCVNCHCLALSAYMAIFMCVVYFYFHMPEIICLNNTVQQDAKI
jgi:hypothetical protein